MPNRRSDPAADSGAWRAGGRGTSSAQRVCLACTMGQVRASRVTAPGEASRPIAPAESTAGTVQVTVAPPAWATCSRRRTAASRYVASASRRWTSQPVSTRSSTKGPPSDSASAKRARWAAAMPTGRAISRLSGERSRRGAPGHSGTVDQNAQWCSSTASTGVIFPVPGARDRDGPWPSPRHGRQAGAPAPFGSPVRAKRVQ